jgi:transcription initiation factor TFIIB
MLNQSIFYKEIFTEQHLARSYLQRFVGKAKASLILFRNAAFNTHVVQEIERMVWFSSPDQMDYLPHIQTNSEQQEEEMEKTRDIVVGSQQQKQQQQRPSCSVCKSAKVITDPEYGEVICSNCGVVISDKLEEINRPERSTYNMTEDTSRTGAPTSIAKHDMGLSTVIANTEKDAVGNKIDISIRSTMQRLRTWDYRTQVHTATNRNLRQAFIELDILKDKLALPDATIEKAAYIYRKAKQRQFIRGRTTLAVIAAALYIACRERGTPRTLKDIARAYNLRHKSICKAYRQLVIKLDYNVPMADPMKCVAKVANNANLTEKTKRQAIDIMNDATKKEITAGKDPMGFAATVLYISCLKTGEKTCQKDIAASAGITEVTIRNRFKDLQHKLQILN